MIEWGLADFILPLLFQSFGKAQIIIPHMKKLCGGQANVDIYGDVISSVIINIKSWKKVTNSDLELKRKELLIEVQEGRKQMWI